MADVFISYKSERRAAAEHLAEILGDYGYSVWWDYSLVAGLDFGPQVERELRAATVVVVLWCGRSRASQWVRSEATLAKTLKSFVPARIEPIELPLDFLLDQTLDLSGWDGCWRSADLDKLILEIERRVGRLRNPNIDGLSRTERAWRRLGAPSLATFPLVESMETRSPGRLFSSDLILDQAPTAAATKAAESTSAAVWATLRDTAEDDDLVLFLERFPDSLEAFAVARELRRRRSKSLAHQAPAPSEIVGETQSQAVRPPAVAKQSLKPPVSGTELCDQLKGGASGPMLVVLPTGRLLMGSDFSEEGRRDDEGPQRLVVLDYSLAVGKFPVAWNQYEAAVRAGACAAPLDDGFGKGSRPVTNVSWEDAHQFANWLSLESGKTYRLLSEAEWEFGCRAKTMIGRGSRWTCGDNDMILPTHAWYSANELWGTRPVGQLAPNAFGLHDMHGNVWEWVEDTYAPSYANGQACDGSAYTNGMKEARVFRGGSWRNNSQSLRSANRGWGPHTTRSSSVGFRLARLL